MNHDTLLRLGAFLFIFATIALWERIAPRRDEPMLRAKRWPTNLLLIVIDTVTLRLLLPTTGSIAVAVLAQQHHWGVLQQMQLPPVLAIAIAIIALDAVIYWQHRLFHRMPLLWRLHRVHHTDIRLDTTSALRFHPVEIFLSMLIKMVAIIVLGVDPLAVVLFEVTLNGMALFNHGNIRLPHAIDRALRWLWVTPDMHRIHHSVETEEFNRNFGFNLSCWDRIFGSYQAQPQAGQLGMTIGLPDWRNADTTANLLWMLKLPWLPLARSAQ
ncbi:MAG: sterol desaturase family protein [Mariprofundales bacterium]|nr:sterol desaturase family protein [Mariprofundales bacterium]